MRIFSILAGSLVAFSLSFAQDGEWVAYRTRGQTFYLRNADLRGLAAGKTAPAYRSPSADRPADATLERNAQGDWIINLTASSGGRYLVSAQPGTVPAEPAPDGVDERIWTVVREANARESRDSRAATARRLQEFSKRDPAAFRGLMASGDFRSFDAALADIREGREPKLDSDRAGGGRVLGRQSAMSPETAEALSRLAERLRDDGVRARAAERVVDLIFRHDAFLSEEYARSKSRHDDQLRLRSAAETFLGQACAEDESRQRMAALYWVIGDADAEWIRAEPSLAPMLGAGTRPFGRWRRAMSSFTREPRKEDPNEPQAGPLSGVSQAEWLATFMLAGSRRAVDVLNAPGVSLDAPRKIQGREDDPTLRIGGEKRKR